ncbi:ral GTPase-activating protein subunit beta isoform X2 [Ixodes scapularis]|uniref:ral GTPase-activating protein subunit beta isoform X2 n=1 Tax=Ixodes scapularis TaxID=6945 RepID=UPI001C3856C6|nr:ral GTPase-activating protein subunit beta isoform X2 [Ixodes scapularis]
MMVRQRDRMYSEWLVLPVTEDARERCTSVLQKFPCAAGRNVVTAVLHSLASNLGISSAKCEPSTLVSDIEVNWCMEVICFGLQLPLSEHEAIRDCVHVYCEWMQALTQPKACVPRPVQEDANQYVRRMLRHLYNLFVPREDCQNDNMISRQAVLCHHVLRRLQSVAQDSTTIEKETWDEILLFLLAVNDVLLAPPSRKDDMGSHLCERILTALFEVWLLACHRCFPSPNLWKTLRELCCTWRHRGALVEQWNRVNLLLTARMLRLMYGHHYPDLKLEEDAQVLPAEMTGEQVAQAWYRFLQLLGDPVDLCRPELISQTPGFYSLLETADTVVDPFQNPCLSALPHIFQRAMAGLATLVDAFLGISHVAIEDDHQKSFSSHSSASSVSGASQTSSGLTTTTPPHQRRGPNRITAIPNFKGMSKPGVFNRSATSSGGAPVVVAGASALAAVQSVLPPSTQPATPSPLQVRSSPASMRPRCNSILHLYGSWLFEAALVGSELDTQHTPSQSQGDGSAESSVHSRSSSVLDSGGSGRGGAQSSLPGVPEWIEVPPCLSAESFEAGQAEAVGALCRLFCAKRTGEEVLPVYFSRFYLALRHSLSNIESKAQVVASVLLNSCDLFRQDMEGVNVLLPLFFQALESVFCPDRESKIRLVPNISQVELRWSSTHLLLSMLPLPLHYGNLLLKDFGSSQTVTFQSLRPRLMNLLIGALQNETDSTNTQMLLGGLLFCVQDATAHEEANQVTQPASTGQDNANMTYSNLLCSDSANALFVRSIYLVCHRLISSWKTDMHVSLAALEVLSGLARIRQPQQDSLECRRAVKWICDFVVYQCQRPPPFHSRDLHSTIVAAFQCLTTWLMAHPLLLQDKECVHYVLEVVELGISGSKSQPKVSDVPLLKAEKELKPSSLRVKDAAEAALSCMMDHVGYFPKLAGPETLSSLLDEEALLKFGHPDLAMPVPEAVGKHFRYFVTQNSAIVAILEENLGNDQGALPTVTLLVRVPFGRHAWTMQLRHLPRHKSGARSTVANPGRPMPQYDPPLHNHPPPSYFPETTADIPTCEIDKSIPDPTSSTLTREEAQMLGFLDQQAKMEKSVCRRWEDAMWQPGALSPSTDCKAPSVCQEFQTARLFLSHLGFLWDDTSKGSSSDGQPLMALDQNQPGFYAALEALDNISSRTNDTVFIFYVKEGQSTAAEILGNVASSRNVHPQFLEFLRSLGWPVDVGMHTGWTGHVSTSWRVTSGDFNIADLPADHGGSLYSGHHQVLYWSDVLSEVVFVVPSPKSLPKDVLSGEVTLRPKADSCSERTSTIVGPSDDAGSTTPLEVNAGEKARAMSLNLDAGEGVTRPARSRPARSTHVTSAEVKVLVVWLESFEDALSFPLGDLLPATNTGQESLCGRGSERDVFVIFVHALQSGLFRIKVQSRGAKTTQALPLVDGMVVSRRVLGVLIRQTAINLCRRRRLEAEMCPPPHVRRRMKIQEIANKFQVHQMQPQLYQQLFKNTH